MANFIIYFALTQNSSLPFSGTHETMARYGTGAVCQHMNLEEQYRYGIRFIDIGGRHYGGNVAIHNGRYYQRIALRFGVIQPTVQFLHENPSEMIIMLVKYVNHFPNKGRLEFVELVEACLNGLGANWVNTMPETLGEGRGKIVVLNQDWPPGRTVGTNIKSFDVYNNEDEHDMHKKWKQTETRLREVQEKDGRSLCITYVSGYLSGITLGLYRNRFAMREYLNPKLNDYCRQNATKGPMGIVLSDSPEKGWDLDAFLSANK